MSDLTRQTQQQQANNGQAVERAADLTRKVYGARTEIAKALGDRIGPDRFLRALATEIRTVEHLDECTPDSVLGGLFVAAQMGLEVGKERGLVWLVPRRNNKKPGSPYEATLQVGYKGWIDLFYRAGARAVQWFLVREGDVFRIGSDPRLGKVYTWEQADPNSTAPVTGAVAQIVTATGGIVWEYLSRADIEKRATDTTFWRKWWDEMALKTVMHRLAATAPMSEQLVLAQHTDETVQSKVPGIEQPVTAHLPIAATTKAQLPSQPSQSRPTVAQATPRAPEPVDEPTAEEWAEIERQQYEQAMREEDELI